MSHQAPAGHFRAFFQVIHFCSHLLCRCCQVSYSAIEDLWLRVFHLFQAWAWILSPWCSERHLDEDSGCCSYILKELGPCVITLVISLVHRYCYKPCHCALSLLLGHFVHWFGIDVCKERVCKWSAIRYCSEESCKFIHLSLPLCLRIFWARGVVFMVVHRSDHCWWCDGFCSGALACCYCRTSGRSCHGSQAL